MTIRTAWLVSFALCLTFASPSFAQQECPGAHCSARSEQINNICKAQGQAGNLVFVEYPVGSGQYCYCRCSCLPPDTPVRVDSATTKALGDFRPGDTALTLNRELKWVPTKVVFSDGTQQPELPLPYAIYLKTDSGKVFVTTPDHGFLLADRKTLRRADRLTPTDRLLDATTLMPVGITELYSGSYLGPLHNIAVTGWNESDDQWGHLIDTAGVVSADYFAQLYLLPSATDSLPQVGSAAHNTKYIRDERAVPAELRLNSGARFTPHRRLSIPKDAVHFLPPGRDIAAPGTLQPLDNTVPYEMAEYLVGHYRRFYPQVTYHIDWTDERVNAFAWREGNVQHVALLGGLLRHRAIRIEGAGLVLAHELGHHFGGPPRYPSGNTWASCEGQSDYWAALVAQRNVWWGPESLRQTTIGGQQLYDLFANGLLQNLFALREVDAAAGVCTHPPAYCRLQTYQAGVRAEPKPSCAGDPSLLNTSKQ